MGYSCCWQSHLWHNPQHAGREQPRGIPAVTDVLHYGYYFVAWPKGAGEEAGFIVFQGSEEAFISEGYGSAQLQTPCPYSFFCSFCETSPCAGVNKWSRWMCRQTLDPFETVPGLSCTAYLLLFFSYGQYCSWEMSCRKFEQSILSFSAFERCFVLNTFKGRGFCRTSRYLDIGSRPK